jgi:GMP synthase (glutamine-hydrolysing)
LQFHPEVTHSAEGREILRNFVLGVCGAPSDWVMRDVAREFIEEVLCCPHSHSLTH